jgi:PAS domain S-box-containing protein
MWITKVLDAIPLASIPLLPLLGVVLYLTLHHALLAARGDSESPHLGVLLLCLTSALFLVGRITQLWTASEAGAVGGVQIQLVGLFCMGSALLLIPQRTTKPWLALVPLAATVLLFTTPAFVPGDTFVRTTAFGVDYFAVKSGPLTYLLIPVCVVGGIVWLHTTHKREAWAQWPRGIWYGLLSAAAGIAIHDVGMNAGLYRSVHLLEYGIVSLTLGVSLLSTRRLRVQLSGLEQLVSERTQGLEDAVQRLATSEARYRQLSDTTFEGIIVHHAGRVVDVNKALTNLLNEPAEALRDADVSSILVDPPAEASDVMLGRKEGPVEATARRNAGEAFPVEVMSRAEAGSVVVALRDISERRDMQSRLVLADRMVSLGTLAAGVAHEVNNPLTSVMTNLQVAQELARQDPVPAEGIEECLVDALEGCVRVKRIVNDLRKLTRTPDADILSNNAEDVLERCLHMATNEIRHRARVVRQYEGTPVVLCNEGRLSQVLLNLLLNAAQAMPVGHADTMCLTVRVRTEDKNVVIEIQDTGSGISPEALPRVFDPFFTTKSPGLGTGLGLSICHTLVTQMGGSIAVESQVDVGTLVRLVLPAAEDSDAPFAAAHSSAPTCPQRRARILVVDDEPTVGRALRRALSDHDLTVARNGRVALELCEAQRFDLVLCDLMMPEMTGMEFFGALSARSPKTCDQVVFMTGGAFTPDAKQFLEAAGRPYIGKPFDLHWLRRLVRELLGAEDSTKPAQPRLRLLSGGAPSPQSSKRRAR